MHAEARNASPAGSTSDAASPIGSVDKALLTLDSLGAAGPDGLPLADLATRLGVNKSTLHRTLAALRHRSYVTQHATSGRYRLGPAALALAVPYLADENLPALLHDALRVLSTEVDELVHLGVLAGDEVIYLDKVEPTHAVRVWSAVGRRVPSRTSALGRALLAYSGDDATPAASSAADPAAEPAADGAPPSAVERALALALERGWAEEVEENEPGITCVAVPILRSGRSVAAVSVSAPAERMAAERREQIAHQVHAAVAPCLAPPLSLPPVPAPAPT
ncbi:transcriptional regulator [Paraoerskovia sediminicola]|uniref:Transcriptional regulator n=1 Tax=Paraoerskovia sediminicola TaxID=1138587 RepID=A0ABN6XBZ9_9CELL|nr:IclR family transcriptional regulator [Paraoerskovia sediminicola]BDZ40988.1 transcriptional regulator [Paraoerskovia sediminicola]